MKCGKMSRNPDSWVFQPGAQERFLSCTAFEALAEGNRGGGKTDVLLMDFARDVGKGYGSAWQGVLFRLAYPDLEDVIARSKKWFTLLFPKAIYNESKSFWTFPGGERLRFRQLSKSSDYYKYHGQEIPWQGFEELTNWATPDAYLQMFSCARTSTKGITPRIRATTNPHGIGHNWVKARFKLPQSRGKVIREGNKTRAAICFDFNENKALLEATPDYLDILKQAAASPEQLKAWTLGDWDIVAGGAIDDVWNPKKHIIRPFDIPSSWKIDRSFDWGSSHPFSVGWWAESDGTTATMKDGSTRTFQRGTVFRINEFYGWNGSPNKGCKMLAVEIAEEVKKIEKNSDIFKGRTVRPGPADGSIFDAENGVCIADDMAKKGIRWTRADKRPGSRKNGLERVRNMLKACLTHPMEDAGLFCFDNCTHFIRTMPVLPRDQKNPDDIDTNAEDHIYDEVRYRCTAPKREVTTTAIGGL